MISCHHKQHQSSIWHIKSLLQMLFSCTLLAASSSNAHPNLIGTEPQTGYAEQMGERPAYHGSGSVVYAVAPAQSLSSALLPSWSSAPATSLPQLNGQGISFADSHHNRQVGAWSLQRLGGSVRLLEDAWVQQVISNLTWQLNAQARQQALMAVLVIDDAMINAFAVPGGVIGINTGIVIEADSMDEVASVLAHEIAHLSQRHYEHSSDASKKALLMQVGGLIAAIAAASADGDAAAAIMMGSQTAAMNSQMAFSRDNEREADRMGMQIMAQAGFDVRAMPQFFATLNRHSQLNRSQNGYLPSFFQTHPLSHERLTEAQSRAQQYPLRSIGATQRQAQFEMLKWRIRVLSQQTSETALREAAQHNDGAALALVQWYIQQQNWTAANQQLKLIEQHSKANPNLDQAWQLLFAVTQAQLAIAQGQTQLAIEILQTQQQLYPERRDLRIYLAQAYNQLGRSEAAQAAQALLQPQVQEQPSDIQAWQLLRQANEIIAIDSDDSQLRLLASINALRYRSQVELWQAKYDAALVSLTQAKQQLQDWQASLSQQAEQAAGHSNRPGVSAPLNPKPLLATIDEQIRQVKDAQAFHP